MRDLNWNVIGLARNPDPPEPDEAVEDAVEARIGEIWADADLLHLALDDASLPFDLHTSTLLRDAHRRLSTHAAWTDGEADLALRAICSALQAAVAKAARHDVDSGDL
jgi:hypothetical protein